MSEILDNLFKRISKYFNYTSPKFLENTLDEYDSVISILEIPKIRELCCSWFEELPINECYTLDELENIECKANLLASTDDKIWEAIKLYTKGLFGISLSDEFGKHKASVFHAKRAELLFHNGFYKAAFEDYLCAIQFDYPLKYEKNNHKIIDFYVKFGISSSFFSDIENATFALNELKKLRISRKLDENNLKKISQYETKLFSGRNWIEKDIRTSLSSPLLMILSDDVKQQLKIEHSPNKGRCVIAQCNLAENKILIKENAFAFVPVFNCGSITNHKKECNKIKNGGDNEYYVCHNCGQDNIIPFPCYECHIASYCSNECRHVHYNSIHKFECFGYKKKLFHKIGISYLAFRVFLQGIHYLIDELINFYNNDKLDTNDIVMKDIWERILELPKQQKQKNPYFDILRLVHNIDKMSNEDLTQYRLTSYLLTIYLRNYTDFYKTVLDTNNKLQSIFCNYFDKSNKFNWDALIILLITRHICQMICNAHSIESLLIPFYNVYSSSGKWYLDNYYEKNVLNDNPDEEQLYINTNILELGYLHELSTINERIFTVIYPNVSIFNHSCESNFSTSFNQTTIIVTANKLIQQNEEIFNCYGTNYRALRRAHRLNKLKSQYYFQCECNHCLDENCDYNCYFKYKYLKCCNENCKYEFILPKNYDDIFDLNSVIHSKIECKCCNKIYEWKWYDEFINGVNSINSSLELKECQKIISYLHKKYTEELSEYFCDKNLLKYYMGFQLIEKSISYCIFAVSEDTNFFKILEIANDILINVHNYHYPNFGYECIRISFFILDLLANRIKKYGYNSIANINFELYLQSFKSLNTKTKQVIKNYIKSYITSQVHRIM